MINTKFKKCYIDSDSNILKSNHLKPSFNSIQWKILKLLTTQEKETSHLKKLFIDTFKRKYLVGCSDLFIKGLRVIDGEVVQETVKIDDDKGQDLSNYSEFPLD